MTMRTKMNQTNVQSALRTIVVCLQYLDSESVRSRELPGTDEVAESLRKCAKILAETPLPEIDRTFAVMLISVLEQAAAIMLTPVVTQISFALNSSVPGRQLRLFASDLKKHFHIS
jgi:hypothetical protein